jgi:hypothetical protein
MPDRTIRLLHRIAVDWVADTWRLRRRQPATIRHEEMHARAYQRARRLPARLHQPRHPRVLTSWQAAIGKRITGRQADC